MKIDLASPEDVKGILRLYSQFEEDKVGSGIVDAGANGNLGKQMPWVETLRDENCVTFVAKEKIVIGFITLRFPEFNPFKKVRKLGEIDLIVVERRLRRRGIGSLLLKHAIDYLRSERVTHALLNVNLKNPAIRFWGKMGFRKISESEYRRADGISETILYMIRKIQ